MNQYDELSELADDMKADLENAQTWAAIWKKAARHYRKEMAWWEKQAWDELARRVRLEVQIGIMNAHQAKGE